jgi:hypothetical protein
MLLVAQKPHAAQAGVTLGGDSPTHAALGLRKLWKSKTQAPYLARQCVSRFHDRDRGHGFLFFVHRVVLTIHSLPVCSRAASARAVRTPALSLSN